MSVATAACLPWRLLLINFRRKGSSASKSTLCWSACRTRTFPHVPLCPLCGSLYWVRKSGEGLRPVQPAVPRRPLSNAGLPVRCEAFETREGLRVCRVTVLPCHRWQHLLHCTRFCWWAPLAEMTSTVHPPSGTTASVLTPSLLGHISIDTVV